jgi:hypothetical protein
MATFDDMDLERKVTVYDKGFDESSGSYGEYITRAGDIWSPSIGNREPLRLECEHFVQCLREGARRARTGTPGCAWCACWRACRPRSTRREGIRMQLSDLAPGLVLGEGVQLGEGVRIGAHVVIHPGTVIGDGCEIQDGAVLGKPPKLARHSTRPRGGGEPLTCSAPARSCARARSCFAGAAVGAGGRSSATSRSCASARGSATGSVIGRGSAVDNDVLIGRRVRGADRRLPDRLQRASRTTSSSARASVTTNDSTMSRHGADFSLEGALLRRACRIGGAAVITPGPRSARRPSWPRAPSSCATCRRARS